MALKQVYNPLSGQFDLVQDSTGYPEVNTFADLPAASSASGQTYLVLTATGNWFTFNRRDAGLYHSNGLIWTYLDGLPDYVKDGFFRVQNSLDQTKQLAFDLSGITTGNTRTLTIPDQSGTIALVGNQWQVGGNTLGANSSLGSIDNFALQLITNNTIRWTISNTGILEATGAQTIRTSTGDLTIATNAANGNILLTPNNTGGVWINPTGTPTAKFYVRGNGTGTGELVRLQDNLDTQRLLFLDNGQVTFGIGSNTTLQQVKIRSISTSGGYTPLTVHDNADSPIWLTRIDGVMEYGGGASSGFTDATYVSSGLLQTNLFFSHNKQYTRAGFTLRPSANRTDTSGSFSGLRLFTGNFQPTSGNANFTHFEISGNTLNQTVTANGSVTGIDYNPIVSSVLGAHYGLLIRPNSLNGFGLGATLPTATIHARGAGNTSSTFTARFERNDGSNIILFRDDGLIRFGSNANSPFLVASNGGSQDIAGTALIFGRTAASGVGRSIAFTDNLTSLTANSSTLAPVSTIQHTSSAFEFSVLQLEHTANQTGTATGVIRAIFSNPVLTSAYNYKAFTFRSTAAYTPNAAITTYDFSEIFPNINASVNNQIIRGLTIDLSGSNGSFTGVQRVALNLIGGVLRVAQLSADPAAATNGDIYYNTTTNKFRGYENGAWANLI